MLKFLKRLFSCFTKKSDNTTDTIELSFRSKSLIFNHVRISPWLLWQLFLVVPIKSILRLLFIIFRYLVASIGSFFSHKK